MTVVTPSVTAPLSVELSADDRSSVAQVAEALCGPGTFQVDDPSWVARARAAWEECPVGLRQPLRAFRRDAGPHGAMIIRGLPVPERTLPDTPSVAGSVQRSATVPATLLIMVAAGLGDPAAFLPEKSGSLVQDVVPVPGKEEFQGNVGSVLLEWHNENAFHPHRPDYVMLLCLRSDHEQIAGLRTACARQVLPLLSETARAALFADEFVTAAPPSFDLADSTVRHAVLTGAEEDPDIQVDLAATTGQTPRARMALHELRVAFDETALVHLLKPGELAIADNRITVHGRTAFQPRYDGRDRWLQRTFVTNDLRRSRHQRPADGYVLM
ncbi:TauD/TfdA family dioxygenase [Nonomuraea sp. NPDC050556]|uniref:TauD/TfdA family dioxygenase n=1 Tax=Nonomuraea sp. NPDC050556 TaxID=3364369 RepID=UPI0037A0B825